MHWSILTPYERHWDRETLAFGAWRIRADAPADEAHEALWRTYYAHIFNPARFNPRMMRQEMPQQYWKHLPEAHLIPALLARRRRARGSDGARLAEPRGGASRAVPGAPRPRASGLPARGCAR